MSVDKTKLHVLSEKCNSQEILKRGTSQADCMDSKPTGIGPTSAVKVFTVFVLSGSLFLLIYNVGRKRLNTNNAHSHSGREPSPPVIANPSTLRGYFSHYKDKPLPHLRKPSLTAALEPLSTTSFVEGNSTSTSDHTDHGASPAPDTPAGESLHSTPSETPLVSTTRSYDPETGPYMVIRKYSNGISQASSGNHPEPSSSATTSQEGQLIEHMRQRTSFSDFRGSTEGGTTCSDPGQRRASCSVLGDMSETEVNFLGTVMEDTQNTTDIPSRVSVVTDVHSDDTDGPRSSSPQRFSTTPHKDFLKPLMYIFIWSVLSYSVDVYSSTGWGAKMVGFPAPFLKATLHFLTQATMSSCMLRWPGNNVFVMPWNTYMFIVAPIATAAVFDHDLRDASVFTVTLGIPMLNKPVGILERAYMMFSSLKGATLETVWDYRMQSKGYVPLCVFLFALAFRLESRNVAVAVSIAIIAVGFIFGVSTGNQFWVMSLKDGSFGPLLSGFRWAAVQVLLQNENWTPCWIISVNRAHSEMERKDGTPMPFLVQASNFSCDDGRIDNANPIDLKLCFELQFHVHDLGAANNQKRELGVVTPAVTMRALSPSMAMVAAIFSLVAEPWDSLLTTEYFDDPDNALKSCGHIMIGALLWTAMALAELVVVYHTSALTLIILGMLKDLCVVVPRMIHDSHFSEQNMVGVTFFLIGLLSLVWLKYQNLLKKNGLEGPSDDTQSVASGATTYSWPGIGACDFPSAVPPVQQFRGYFERASGACARVSRKLRALWSRNLENPSQS